MRVRGVGVALCLLVVGALALSACATTNKANSGTAGQGAGTAAGPIPGSQEDLVVNVGDRVFFDYNEYALKDEGRATLQRQAAWMKKYPQVAVQVEGHCDERGTREYNLALGSRRATAAKDYLVSLGVDAARISTISYGKERPVCVESAESCYSINRRAVTVVSKTGAGT
jgi:peptidoglycan-associated lipoprotein